jgi:hypothetical protein
MLPYLVIFTCFITKYTEGVGMLVSEKLSDNYVRILSDKFQIAMVETLLKPML